VAAGIHQLSELETLVEAFEQVTFAPDSDESLAAARRAVSTARQVVDSEG
jgi:alkylhydroperoxidase family enzyme